MTDIRSVLLIHTAFPGDLILLTPVIQALYDDPQIEKIGLVIQPNSAGLFETDYRIKWLRVYYKRGIDSGWKGFQRVRREIREKRFDAVLCPHRYLRSALLTFGSKARTRIGFRGTPLGGICFTQMISRHNGHEVERNLDLYRALRPERSVSNRLSLAFKESPEKDETPYFAFAPFSTWMTKQWPLNHAKRWVEKFLEITPWNLVLIGGHSDRESAEMLNISDRVNNATGASWRDSYFLLKNSMGLLTMDSAPLHLGEAAGIPVWAMFGATSTAFGFGPRGVHSRVIQNQGLYCRPCRIHGGRRCPEGHFRCMEELAPEFVLDLILKDLECSGIAVQS